MPLSPAGLGYHSSQYSLLWWPNCQHRVAMVTSTLAPLSLLFQLNYPANPPVCLQRTQFLVHACFRSPQSSKSNIQPSGQARVSADHWLPLLASGLQLLILPGGGGGSTRAHYSRHTTGFPSTFEWWPSKERPNEGKRTKPKKNPNPKTRKSKCSWKAWLTGENLATTSIPALSGQRVEHWASLPVFIVLSCTRTWFPQTQGV